MSMFMFYWRNGFGGEKKLFRNHLFKSGASSVFRMEMANTHDKRKPNVLNAEPICLNSRLSEFRINLFIDNFSSFHFSNNISFPAFFSLSVCVLLRSDQFIPNVCSASPFSCTFRLVFALVLIFEWIFIVILPHYVFWLQISVLNYAKTDIILPKIFL